MESKQFEKAKAHSDDAMNNLADTMANEGCTSGRIFDIRAIVVPGGWVDTSPVLCHQPLDYLTKLTMRARIQAPTDTLKFRSFSDRWTVTIGNMFGVVLDPGSHIGGIWNLTIPEGLKEVLWKEMNGAQVLDHRYYGMGLPKSALGRFCICGEEMSLQRILISCEAYKLQPLLETLIDILREIPPNIPFKTLHLDEWGHSPWYPLLALKELEENALLIFKGRKATIEALRRTRQKREWIIGNYYWAIWKWRMKEIHEEKFKFVPWLCGSLMKGLLLLPVPTHLLVTDTEADDKGESSSARIRFTDSAYR